MTDSTLDQSTPHFVLTASDLRRAALESVLSAEDVERLIAWGVRQSTTPQPTAQAVEKAKGLNLATIAYYFGAMLMISACAWFLGDKWNDLGSRGILATALVYFGVAAATGAYMRRRGFLVAGGLLVTVAVSLVPLITYSIEDLAGVWPGTNPGPYKYNPWVHGSWIVMELSTIAAAAVALRFVRFSFLTAPMAFSLWFFSMDVAAWALSSESLDWNTRCWTSVIVGLVTMAVGYGLDRTLGKTTAGPGQDFAFWCYFFGLLAFWGGMTSMDSHSELGRAVYAAINLGLIGVSPLLRRSTFLVFGALGVNVYIGHLAYDLFKDSFFFPFVLALVGLLSILLTVWFQRRLLSPAADRSNEAVDTQLSA
jgi:hypothetical protein